MSKLLFSKHTLTVGNEYRDHFRQKQVTYDEEPYFLYLQDQRSSQVWAVYAQDEYAVRKGLLLNVGVRYDHYTTFGGTTNPRLGLIYSPLAKTTLKFLYGSAFRAPNAFELFYEDGTSMQSNPKLWPESIRTVEFVAEQYIGERYRLSGSFFQNRIERLIDQVTLPSGLLQFQNISSVRAKGVELVFERKWTSGLAAQLNYTFQQAVDRQTGARLVNSPAHLANLNLLIPLLPRRPRTLTAGLDLHYVSARRTLAGNLAPGFLLTNVTLFNQRLFKGLELAGSVYNLLDRHYGYPGGGEHLENILYQDGRNVRLKLVYTFGAR